MLMPASSAGGTWLSADVIGKGAANLKSNLVIPFNSYTPVFGTDTIAGQLVIDSNGCVLYVVNAANNAYGIAINQSLRSSVSLSFAGLTVNTLNTATLLGYLDQSVQQASRPTCAGLTINNTANAIPLFETTTNNPLGLEF